MASIKNLKKDINYVLGDVIDVCLMKLPENTKQSEEIIDEAIKTFDELIAKINAKNVDNKKAHFRSISTELEAKANELLDKIEKL